MVGEATHLLTKDGAKSRTLAIVTLFSPAPAAKARRCAAFGTNVSGLMRRPRSSSTASCILPRSIRAVSTPFSRRSAGRSAAGPGHGVRSLRCMTRTISASFVKRMRIGCAAGREGDAFPYTFPIVGRRPLELSRIDARLGQFGFDTSTPIGPGTWEACYWSVQTALAALEAVLVESECLRLHPAARPSCGARLFRRLFLPQPCGGLRRGGASRGQQRIAILDVDYHHGNGTQDIFAGREDVVFASIHADPSTDYPFFWGHADESGGNILNLPLPRGTDWSGYAPALTQALDWIEGAHPICLSSATAPIRTRPTRSATSNSRQAITRRWHAALLRWVCRR